ncbi:antibiotic biosynthesis monooxygenase family protein [Pseudoneobacillus sp. C159]
MMKVYITTGTIEFLMGMKEKKATESMVLMQNQEQALLYHETNGKTIFQAPRRYELIDSNGELNQIGFVAMNHESIKDEEQPIFVERTKKILAPIESYKGFKAYRFLKPEKILTYLLITLWENEISYRNWQKTASYQDVFQQKSVDLNTKLFSPQSYVSTYFLIKEG